MSARDMWAEVQVPEIEELPAILASLGLKKQPDMEDWQDENNHRIHWALRVLQYSGYQPVAVLKFDQYICGPYAENLDGALQKIEWADVLSAYEIDDDRVHAVREAVQKGDDFLLALSVIVGVHDYNKGSTRNDVVGHVTRRMPDLEYVAETAYDFAEERIWPK